MQGNPCYARLFADLPYTPPNPIITSGGCGPRTPGGFSTDWPPPPTASSRREQRRRDPAAPGRRVGEAHPSAAGQGPAAGPQRGLGPAAPPPRRTGLPEGSGTAPPAKPLPMPYGQRRLTPPAAGYRPKPSTADVARLSLCAQHRCARSTAQGRGGRREIKKVFPKRELFVIMDLERIGKAFRRSGGASCENRLDQAGF